MGLLAYQLPSSRVLCTGRAVTLPNGTSAFPLLDLDDRRTTRART